MRALRVPLCSSYFIPFGSFHSVSLSGLKENRARRLHTGRVLCAPFHYDFVGGLYYVVSLG
jgi:hypothetical protein